MDVRLLACAESGGGGGEIDGSVTDRQIDRQKDS